MALPEQAKVVWYYRNEEFRLADESTLLEVDDEVVIATHSEHLEELHERWRPKDANDS